MSRRKTKRKIGLFIVTMMVMGTVMTVKGQESRKARLEEKYYQEAESEYLREVRAFLQEEGYENSGVTMTKVYEEDGGRSYTILIHHRKISTLEEPEKKALQEKLEDISFPIQNCHFCHSFFMRET